MAGATQISPLSAMLMVLLAGLCAGIVLSTPTAMARVLSVFPGIGRVDDTAYANIRAVLESETSSDVPAIYLLGGSTLRHSLDSEQYLEQLVGKGLGSPVRVVDMTSPAQRLQVSREAATAAICGKGRGVLFLAANAQRAGAHDPDAPFNDLDWPSLSQTDFVSAVKDRAAFATSILTRELRPTLLAGARQGIAALAGSSWRAPVRYSYEGGRLRYLRTGYSAARVERTIDEYERRLLRATPQSVDVFLDDVGKLAATIESCSDVQIVLVDTPLHPAVFDRPVLAQTQSWYRQEVSAFAAEEGLRYEDVGSRVAYEPRDFADYGHLRTRAASKRTTAYLAEVAVDLLAKPLEKRSAR